MQTFHCDITARLCRWAGILGAWLVVPDTEAGLQDPSPHRQSPACLQVHRDPPPPARIPGAQKPRGLGPPKAEACAYFWPLRISSCRVTSQARNLHQKAKKNTSKNKHESQDFVPGTPATHILLAASLASLLAVRILLKTERKPASMSGTYVSAPLSSRFSVK